MLNVKTSSDKMKSTGFFVICMFALLIIVVSARHMEDEFESDSLVEFDDGLGQHNRLSKRGKYFNLINVVWSFDCLL